MIFFRRIFFWRMIFPTEVLPKDIVSVGYFSTAIFSDDYLEYTFAFINYKKKITFFPRLL